MNKRQQDSATESTVFFAPLPAQSAPADMAAAAERLWKAMKLDGMIRRGALVAVKQHFGEDSGTGYLPPPVAAAVGGLIRKAGGKPFLTDSNTLYTGRRSNAVDHLELAREHGFSHDALGFPVIIADGLKGEAQVALRRDSGALKKVFLSACGYAADACVVLTHVTGHLAAGLGASLKNVAMGLAGRGGKLHQHHGAVPNFNARRCTACGCCVRHCPAAAIEISDRRAVVNPKLCIGCGECFVLCPEQAIDFDWADTGAALQKKMAEYCLAYHEIKKGRIAYFNYMTRVTRHCDCMGSAGKGLPDLGVAASLDPVAADSAAIALLNERFGKDVFRDFWPDIDASVQLRHGEKIGLGSTRYSLVRL